MATLLGAFAGAWGAFRFETRHKAAERRAGQISAGRHVLFLLDQQRGVIETLENQHLAILRKAGGWTKAAVAGMPRRPEIDIDELAFFFERNLHHFMRRLSAGESRFRELLHCFDQRGVIHAEFLRGIEPSLLPDSTIPPGSSFEDLAGPRLTAQLQGVTKDLLDASDQAMKANRQNVAALHAELCRAFPGVDFWSSDSEEVRDVPSSESCC